MAKDRRAKEPPTTRRPAWVRPLLAVLREVSFIFLGVLLTWYLQPKWDAHLDPEKQLRNADSERNRMSPASLNRAIVTYKTLLDEPRVRTVALRGLSFSYSDLCTVERWMGVSHRRSCEDAVEYADLAKRERHGDNAVMVAFAYLVRGHDGDKEVARETLRQARPRRQDLNWQYLSWRLGLKGTDEFEQGFEPGKDTSFRILLAMTWNLINKAVSSNDIHGAQMERAEEWLRWAEGRWGENPVTYFTQGYVKQIQAKYPDAKAAYERAIEIEPGFAMAHMNLGVIAAQGGDYQTAVAEFDHAYSQEPTAHNLILLGNLAEANFELEKTSEACRFWHEASTSVGGAEDFHIQFGMAMCSLVRGREQEAVSSFEEAIRIAGTEGIDLLDEASFNGWSAGPRVKHLAKRLIDLRLNGTPRGAMRPEM